MMHKVIDIVFSFVPTNWNFEWTKTIFSPKKRAREDELEDNLPTIPSKKQRLYDDADVLAELNFPLERADKNNCQPPEKILRAVKRKIAYNRNENNTDFNLKLQEKPRFFKLKYDSFKENVQHPRCRSTPVAPLSPAKFKNTYKAPKHIRSPHKVKENYLKNITQSSTPIIDLTKSTVPFRRIPPSIKMSDKENGESSSQPSAENTTVNGNRFANLTRDDYNRLIGRFNVSRPVNTQASVNNEASSSAATTSKTVDKDIYDISDDESEPKLIASPPVQPFNSMAAKAEETLAKSGHVLKMVSTLLESKKRFEELQRKYANGFDQTALIRHKSSTDYLIERIKDHVKLTECVLSHSSISEQPLPRLTPEMEKRILDAFRPYPCDAIIANKYKYKLTRKEFHCLANLNWLNDEVINFYMELISMRCKEDKSYPNVHTFGTFFYPRLKSTGPASLKRWTKKVDIFDCEMILVPIHLHVHWCMSCIDLKKKSITFYDSMGSNNTSVLKALKEYLEYEYKEKKNKTLDMSDWSLNQAQNIPQQNNGSDCGVFACQFAEFLSRNADFTFSQNDMPYFRKKMAWEFMDGKLLT